MTKKRAERPQHLYLLKVDPSDDDETLLRNIDALATALTGAPGTPEEMAEMRAELAKSKLPKAR